MCMAEFIPWRLRHAHIKTVQGYSTFCDCLDLGVASYSKLNIAITDSPVLKMFQQQMHNSHQTMIVTDQI